ncbi:hypothetical protein BD310DRAFT_819367, partial [Dichomitus squalens]
LPLIWDQCIQEAVKDYEAACKKYDVTLRKHKDAAAKHEASLQALRTQVASPNLDPRERTKVDKKIKELTAKAPNPPLEPTPRMQEAEVPLMLSLGGALKLLLASPTSASDRQRGAHLLFSYLQQYKRIYGLQAMVPNHHFATHIPSQLEEYGTVYEIWAFLAERLNKTLKSTNQNNRRGGQQEVTMMREFDRHMQVRAIVEHVSTLSPDGTNEVDVSRSIAQRFLHELREARGTVEAIGAGQAHETAVQHDVFCLTAIGLGVRSARAVQVDMPLCDAILRWYTQNRAGTPEHHLYHAYDCNAPPGATFLDPTAHTLSYIILDGRRITPRTSSGIVKVSLPQHPYLAGDVARLLIHQQPGHSSPAVFAEVLWLVPQDIEQVANNPWRD